MKLSPRRPSEQVGGTSQVSSFLPLPGTVYYVPSFLSLRGVSIYPRLFARFSSMGAGRYKPPCAIKRVTKCGRKQPMCRQCSCATKRTELRGCRHLVGLWAVSTATLSPPRCSGGGGGGAGPGHLLPTKNGWPIFLR